MCPLPLIRLDRGAGSAGDRLGGSTRVPATLHHMVKRPRHSVDAIFAALADPTRRRIIAHLARADATVSELAQPLGASLPAISKHLHILEHAGLLRHEKVGRTRVCRLTPRPLRKADRWLASYRVFWEQRLDSLAKYLEGGADGG